MLIRNKENNVNSYRLGILEGDGIGKEIVPATVEAIDAVMRNAGHDVIEWVPLVSGWESINRYGVPVAPEVFAELDRCDGWILGPNDGNSYPKEIKGKSADDGGLRKRFQLFANVRPSKNIPGVASVGSDIDLVIVRENLEGFYPEVNMYEGNAEFMTDENTALCVGVFTRRSIDRISRYAFDLARQRRGKVTVVHKANALRRSSGLFRRVALEVAEEYPDVEVDERLVDAMTANLVRRPSDFDVVLTENMFGDILSDLAGELAGSIGLSPTINAGDGVAMAQAAHGAAPDIAGQGVANPTGMMLSAAMLLEWLGDRSADPRLHDMATALDTAVRSALSRGIRTRDLGGRATTREFTDAVIALSQEQAA
ncbi:isocitrate/isopropylmalate family dehydrogenase [Galbitalea sp. SE-J8]|uniref:isocitrate/isopropylmalate dehydrogenase family protein n=1 Tax=Galbitalea sp. SE-J8 TaxID=3054952 RepID=UPI00259CA85C|nr:isocitrate/isopropylmalate family dehydrogenase [Galbitalea sp. SE-J8]MDM4762996.1 isocitrate/isopropylmalate family dehydrogenase [Galbitalea sp. SE-J8]